MCLSLHASRLQRTCHIRRSVLILVAPDPQLAVVVVAPALDPAPGRNRARVVIPHGYGYGEEVWGVASEEGRMPCKSVVSLRVGNLKLQESASFQLN